MIHPWNRLAPLVFTAAITGCITAQKQEMAASRARLGQAYLREQSPASAVQILEEAVSLDRYNHEAWQNLALAYMAQGSMDQAEDAFQRALNLSDNDAEIHNNYGLLLMHLERREEAIAHFESALEDITYRSPALAMSNLGYVLFLEQRHPEALNLLTEAIRRAPQLCQAQYNRGLVYRALDEQDLALADFQDAIEQCGMSLGNAYMEAAELMLAQGDVYGGCVYLGEVASADPHSALGRQAREARARSCQQ